MGGISTYLPLALRITVQGKHVILGSHSLTAGAPCVTQTWFLIKGLDDEVEKAQSTSPTHPYWEMEEAVRAFIS